MIYFSRTQPARTRNSKKANLTPLLSGGFQPAALAAGLLTLLAIILWGAVAFPETATWVQALDDRWHAAIAAREWLPLVVMAQGLALAGSGWVTVPLRIIVALWLWRRRHWTRLGTWVLAIIAAQVSTILGKLLYERPRPDDRLMEVVSTSFPSEHATNAAVIGLTLVFILVPPGARRRRWLVLAVAFALLMAWSRTYLRVHWLSDVTGGLLSGFAWALWAALLAPRLIGFHQTSRASTGSTR